MVPIALDPYDTEMLDLVRYSLRAFNHRSGPPARAINRASAILLICEQSSTAVRVLVYVKGEINDDDDADEKSQTCR